MMHDPTEVMLELLLYVPALQAATFAPPVQKWPTGHGRHAASAVVRPAVLP
jgi:hypothetical protein